MPGADIRVLVTGGGTGGHTLPAIAVIQELRQTVRKALPDTALNIVYVGSETGLERKLSADENVDFKAIATGKLRRATNPLKMINRSNLIDGFRVPVGFLQALKIVRSFRPDVIFSTGGYVSIPAVFAGWMLNVPILMHEQTVQLGLANRWSAHVATRIGLSFAESAAELDENDRRKSFVTGGVVRSIVIQGDRQRGREHYGFVGDLTDLPIVFVTGGAQGSSLINEAVGDSMELLVRSCCIIHQCGKQRTTALQDEDILKSKRDKLPPDLRKRVVITAYIGDEIGDVYAASDLVVGRSGAGTVGDVCAAGKAALFIPLVPTGGDEQTKNARRLENLGAARVLPQSEVNGQSLVSAISDLLADRGQLRTMGEIARNQYHSDAAQKLADTIVELGIGFASTTA